MSRSLDDLSFAVRPMMDVFLANVAKANIDWLVTCTLRTMAEQAALYAQGRTTPGLIVTHAPPGESAHQYGLALDGVPIVNGKPDWLASDPVWLDVGEIGEAAGLEWAGRWKGENKEFPHFQLPNWRDHIPKAGA